MTSSTQQPLCPVPSNLFLFLLLLHAMDNAAIGPPQAGLKAEDQPPRTPQSMTPAINKTDHADEQPACHTKGWRFWATFPALCLTSMLAAVESTVTSTALPSITKALGAGDLYVWFANSYFLTSTVFLPLIGQLADIFGRRHVMIGVVAIFTLGSGISGGASSPVMLIAGRAIQGIGGGGINLMIEVVVSDLVPLRERGNYMALIFAVFCLGTAIGPFVGGGTPSYIFTYHAAYLFAPPRPSQADIELLHSPR